MILLCKVLFLRFLNTLYISIYRQFILKVLYLGKCFERKKYLMFNSVKISSNSLKQTLNLTCSSILHKLIPQIARKLMPYKVMSICLTL